MSSIGFRAFSTRNNELNSRLSSMASPAIPKGETFSQMMWDLLKEEENAVVKNTT